MPLLITPFRTAGVVADEKEPLFRRRSSVLREAANAAGSFGFPAPNTTVPLREALFPLVLGTLKDGVGTAARGIVEQVRPLDYKPISF